MDCKRKLSFANRIAVASMLFGMFFGAGNLIFPIHMGQAAGANMLPALLGFLITAVGMPLLAVAALGSSHVDSLFELAGRVSRFYRYAFPIVLSLAIGPCFAIPRCATTSYTIAFANSGLPLVVFSAAFFLLVLAFSLKPSGILNSIGRFLNPAFLLFFLTLILFSYIHPMSPSLAGFESTAEYSAYPFIKGLIEGYNTMDVLAGLLFGIVVVDVLKGLGLEDGREIASATVVSGIYCCLLMALIYAGGTIMGASSRGAVELSANGGIALADICRHLFSRGGVVMLGLIVTLACLKTAIGLVVSICGAFDQLFTGSKHYNTWAVSFVLFAFAISNFGLDLIIALSLPVLMLLYPLAIVLTLLALSNNLFGGRREVYVSTTCFAFAAALFDFLHAAGVTLLDPVANRLLPLYSLGLGWIVPALIGFAVGVLIAGRKQQK